MKTSILADRVLVRGKTRDSLTTDVVSHCVTVLRHDTLPTPLPANFQQLICAQRDCMVVSVRATLRSAGIANLGNMHGAYLKLLMDGGLI